MKFITGLRTYENGVSKIFDLEGFKTFVRNNPNTTFELRISKKRTNKQNRTYWMYVNILSDHLGYTNEEVHEILKFKFLKNEKVDLTTGEILEFVRSTTDLSTSEFVEFIDKIRVWSIENLNVNLPLPNEQINLFNE